MNLRWLHVSDIHECDRNGHLRKRMYDEIVREAGSRHPPDLVFLTGDMAFSGYESEYLSLERSFIDPLKKKLPAGCPVFSVPGNHDLNRERASKPRLWIADAEEREAFQSVDARGAAKRKDLLLPRFHAYAAFDRRISAWGANWLESESGAAWWNGEIKGAKIAVVGINTAWLCQDDHDWGKLTPGRYMLERALDEALRNQPELLFVLGHHPLAALGAEGEPGDAQRVRERLAQANAIYLHGHLHASGSDRIGDSLRNTLTVQAPSAFQAHDDQRWRNGLMWGEADLATGALLLEPRLWNEEKREYKFDINAGYEDERMAERDAFRIPFRKRTLADVEPPATQPKPPDLPGGWELIDRDALNKVRKNPPTLEVMVQFFDGILPTWRLALARGVQPRAIAGRLANRFRAVHAGASKPEVVLLTGAGGEGKSTAVLHTAATLVEDQSQDWTCIHRQAAYAELPEDTFAKLPVRTDHAWIIAVDDADNIASPLLAAVKKIAARTDVHLLIAARDAEWRLKGLVPGLWQMVSNFHVETLAGLDREDACRIVAGWVAWGDGAMGRLKGRGESDAVSALLSHAHDYAARMEQGELLGALLMARQGDDMRSHVRTLINGLGRAPVTKKHSLYDVYAMVAAMHAENQLYLSRSVLAYALGCDGTELNHVALLPLRREAVLDSGDTYVLTRHRIIAEAACAVMHEDGSDVDRWYPFLAAAALRDFRRNYTRDPAIEDWCIGLSEHFISKGRRWWPVARAIAKALYEADPGTAHRITTYSSVLRRTEMPADAMAMLRANGSSFRNRRDVLFEWGHVAGLNGDRGLSAWLCGRTLADGGEPMRPNDCKLSLAGLGFVLRELFQSSQIKEFAAGRAACGQLGLLVPELDPSTRSKFEVGVAETRRAGFESFSLEQAISAVREAVILAADEAKPENTPVFFADLIGEPDRYQYTALHRMIGRDPSDGHHAKRK